MNGLHVKAWSLPGKEVVGLLRSHIVRGTRSLSELTLEGTKVVLVWASVILSCENEFRLRLVLWLLVLQRNLSLLQ